MILNNCYKKINQKVLGTYDSLHSNRYVKRSGYYINPVQTTY